MIAFPILVGLEATARILEQIPTAVSAQLVHKATDVR